MAKYDRIGKTYDSTRKADPYLLSRMMGLLNPIPEEHYLDIGCGSGNYTSELFKSGLQVTGIDPSEEMLMKARQKAPEIKWIQGTAEQLPFPDASFDGVLVSLSIHHWKNLEEGFKEISRVLKSKGRFVLFTSLPEQTANYWLRHFFPKMIEQSAQALPSFSAIKHALDLAQLRIVKEEKYEIQPDLQDKFLYCGKHNPELYFKEEIRAGISSFTALANKDEVAKGLAALRSAIDSGNIAEKRKDIQQGLGDYLFLQMEKKPL